VEQEAVVTGVHEQMAVLLHAIEQHKKDEPNFKVYPHHLKRLGRCMQKQAEVFTWPSMG
jgi:hypothetical protein